MTTVTVRLTDREIKMLKARAGEGDAAAALKAWVAFANPVQTPHRTPRRLIAAYTSRNWPSRPSKSECPRLHCIEY
jgi:hypothetical protein